MKILRTSIIAGAIITLLGAAVWASPRGNAADQKPDPAAIARGAKSWAENCARCHNPRDPKDFRDDQWKVIMTHMRIRAGLTGNEANDILTFLQSSN